MPWMDETLRGGLALALTAWLTAGAAAELRGTVHLHSTGLFRAAIPAGMVSVAALPLEGQPVPAAAPRTWTMTIRDLRLSPSFLTIRRGDRVAFVNRDPVYHELFSLSRAHPFDIRLGRATDGPGAARREERFDGATTWNIFCRIHRGMYARIDVVDTPYFQTLEPGQGFDFRGLAPGRWRLRVAAPGAETRYLDVVAVTAPPPVAIELAVRGGTMGKETDAVAGAAINRLYPDE